MPKINQLTPAVQIADTDVLAKENASGTSTEAVTAAQLAEYAKRKGIQVDSTLSTPGAAADAAKTGAAVADLINALFSILSTNATAIVGTSEIHEDLDDYKTPGNFKVTSAANAALVDHGPVTNAAYRLVVLETSANNRFAQIALLNTTAVSEAKIVIRNFNGTAWSAWKILISQKFAEDLVAGSSIGYIAPEWEQGGIAIGTGLDADSTMRIRSKYITVTKNDKICVTVQKGDTARVFAYSKSGSQYTYIRGCEVPLYNDTFAIVVPNGINAIRILARKNEEAAITPDYGRRYAIYQDFARLYVDDENADIPGYILTEADSVSERVRSVQTPGTFTFATISDLHYYYQDPTVKRALRDMVKGLQNIARQTKIDYLLALGDYIYRTGTVTDFSAGKIEMIECTKDVYDAFASIPCPQIRLVGNHDPNSLELTDSQLVKYFSMNDLYNFIGSHNKYTKDPMNPGGSYGYIDLPDQKIRIIALNTSDFTDEGHPVVNPSTATRNSETTYMMSKRQISWLIDTLKLSGIDGASNWKILVIAHMAIDSISGQLYQNMGNFNPASILGAYQNGTSGSFSVKGTSIAYNFSGIDRAELVPMITGHNHSYNFGNVVTGSTSSSASDIIKVLMPNALPGRESEVLGYPKTEFTAESTAFCVNVLDRTNKILHSIHYGAGVDRIVHYGVTTVSGSASVTPTLTGALTWETKNSAVATVSNGTITAVSAGNTSIYATDSAGNMEIWNITV